MARRDQKNNPSDIDGIIASQGTVMGVVVDVNDPTQSGRVRIRMLGEQPEGTIPDDELPWYPVMTNNMAQSRGVGMFPAGGNYLPGSRVMMRNMGQQGFILEGSVPNSKEDDGTMDRSTESKPGTYHLPGGRQRVKEYDGEPHSKRYEQGNNTTDAISIHDGTKPTPQEKSNDRQQRINNEYQTPQRFQTRPQNREESVGKPKSLGSHSPYSGDTNAQNAVKSVPRGEFVDNAINMMESLKKTAQNGSNPDMPDSVGGMGNIMGALSSILSNINKVKKTIPQPPKCPCLPDDKECLEKNKDSLCYLEYQEYKAKHPEEFEVPTS